MNQELAFFLSGRLLLEEELPFSLHDQPVQFLQGVSKEKNHYHCARCGNHSDELFAQFPCARCGQICTYCRNCLMMGRISECSRLVRWTGPTPTKREDGQLNWEGQLSKGQLVASDAIVEAVQKSSEWLVWAV